MSDEEKIVLLKGHIGFLEGCLIGIQLQIADSALVDRIETAIQQGREQYKTP